MNLETSSSNLSSAGHCQRIRLVCWLFGHTQQEPSESLHTLRTALVNNQGAFPATSTLLSGVGLRPWTFTLCRHQGTADTAPIACRWTLLSLLPTRPCATKLENTQA